MSQLKGTKTHVNLKEAFAGESQANRRYLYFAKQADRLTRQFSRSDRSASLRRFDFPFIITSPHLISGEHNAICLFWKTLALLLWLCNPSGVETTSYSRLSESARLHSCPVCCP